MKQIRKLAQAAQMQASRLHYENAQAKALEAFVKLKSINTRWDDGNYHYHSTKKYPYLNGGFYGEVIEKEGQVDPQPRAEPLRPSLPPMKGAKIVDFKETKAGSYLLTYDISGKKGTIAYALGNDGTAQFTFTGTDGKATTENYSRRERRGGGGGKGGPPPRPGDDEMKKNRDNPPPRTDGQQPPRNDGRPPPPPNRPDDRPPPPPPRNGDRPPRYGERPMPTRTDSTTKPTSNVPQLKVSSTSLDVKGFLVVDCTCDGKGVSPSVAWVEAPKGTKSFAISLWHTANGTCFTLKCGDSSPLRRAATFALSATPYSKGGCAAKRQ